MCLFLLPFRINKGVRITLELNKILGKNIRQFREIKELTQEQLAEKAGLTGAYLGYIERGERNPSLETIDRIAKALQVEPVSLLQQLTCHNGKELKRLTVYLASKDKKHILFLYKVACAYFETLENK
ncbi:MAG: XRE family transcriptional regulator [Peptococcaceae bacterium]|nr:MAG: XRE family transcriptional regulator [Peptococcaceae bacterium]